MKGLKFETKYLGGHINGFADIPFYVKSNKKSFSREKQYQCQPCVHLSTLSLQFSPLYLIHIDLLETNLSMITRIFCCKVFLRKL